MLSHIIANPIVYLAYEKRAIRQDCTLNGTCLITQKESWLRFAKILANALMPTNSGVTSLMDVNIALFKVIIPNQATHGSPFYKSL